jgi:hypothetical protein
LLPVDVSDWDRAFKPGFRLQAEEVVRAVRGEPSRAVTLEDANRTMRLIHTLFDSTAGWGRSTRRPAA